MKQFMEAQELARDRRFKRTKSQNTLLRSLPDDVDEIVRIFESIADKDPGAGRGEPPLRRCTTTWDRASSS